MQYFISLFTILFFKEFIVLNQEIIIYTTFLTLTLIFISKVNLLKALSKTLSFSKHFVTSLYRSLAVQVILHPFLYYCMFFFIFFFGRAYFVHIVYADDRTLWEQMNGNDPSEYLELDNGTTIRLFSNGEGMDYMQIEDEITPLGSTIVVGSNYKPRTYATGYFTTDPWESSDYFESDLYTSSSTSSSDAASDSDAASASSDAASDSDAASASDSSSSSNKEADPSSFISAQPFDLITCFKEFNITVSSCKTENETIQATLAYVKANVPSNIWSGSEEELKDERSPLNIMLENLFITIPPETPGEVINGIHFKTAATVYNSTQLLGVDYNDPRCSRLLVEMYSETFVKYYQSHFPTNDS